MTQPVTVILRGGVYPQTETMVFTPADSGTKECPVTYRAYPGEKPVISGGNVIRDWKADDSDQSRTRCEGKLWRATVPAGEAGRPWRFKPALHQRRAPDTGQSSEQGLVPPHGWPHLQKQFAWILFPRRRREAVEEPARSHRCRLSLLGNIHHHVRNVDTDACLVELHEPAPWAMDAGSGNNGTTSRTSSKNWMSLVSGIWIEPRTPSTTIRCRAKPWRTSKSSPRR